MTRLNRFSALLFIVFGLNAPAFSQSVTYDFSGISYGGVGTYSSNPAGSIVTGTVTFDLGAADPNLSTGTPGSASYNGITGTYLGGASPNPSSLVFSMTATGVGFSYATVTPSAGESSYFSDVENGAYAPMPGGLFIAEEFQQGVAGGPLTIGFLQIASNTGGVPYNSAGLPYSFSGGPVSGEIEGAFYTDDPSNNSYNGVDWSLTSVSVVSAVPETSTYVMILAGLGLLGGATWRRRKILAANWNGSTSVLSSYRHVYSFSATSFVRQRRSCFLRD